MGNSGTKYNASRGDESGNVEVCPFDLLDRIKINYVDKQSNTQCNFNGFSIFLQRKTLHMKSNWNDFGICNENDLKQLLHEYARKYITIWTDIDRYNNNTANNNCVIKDIKFDDYNDYYHVIFNDNINDIDPNWHEKLYAAFVKYPLVCELESIIICTNIHEPSGIEQQLTQMFNGMIRLCSVDTKFNPFEEPLTMKHSRNTRYMRQLVEKTQSLANKIKQLTIMDVPKLQQGEQSKYGSETACDMENRKMEGVDVVITQSQQMVNTLKQNIRTMPNNQNENVLENVFFECERIENTIRERSDQIDKTLNNIDLSMHWIEKQVQEMIEYDWNIYNINIFQQWEQRNGEQQQQIQKQYTTTEKNVLHLVGAGIDIKNQFSNSRTNASNATYCNNNNDIENYNHNLCMEKNDINFCENENNQNDYNRYNNVNINVYTLNKIYSRDELELNQCISNSNLSGIYNYYGIGCIVMSYYENNSKFIYGELHEVYGIGYEYGCSCTSHDNNDISDTNKADTCKNGLGYFNGIEGINSAGVIIFDDYG